MGKIKEIAPGTRFGLLTVVSLVEKARSAERAVYYLCKCDCGRGFEAIGAFLRTYRYMDCGKTCTARAKKNRQVLKSYRQQMGPKPFLKKEKP